jgi:hypothetical protein
MNSRFDELRKSLYDLEREYNKKNVESFDKVINNIRVALYDLKKEFEDGIKVKYETTQVVNCSNSNIINTLQFLYKPMDEVTYYRDEYIERFGEKRTEELMKSMAINQHNEFWKIHETVNGNVYGSVPIELINEESVSKLLNYNWKIVDVNIREFPCDDKSTKEMVDYCNSNFENYIIVVEKETKTYLILEYLI